MRPSKSELNKKTWYRLLKVLAYLFLVVVFISPWFIHEPNYMLILDGVVNVIIWLILIYIIRNIILYILYGKKEIDSQEKILNQQKRKDIIQWILWSFGFF